MTRWGYPALAVLTGTAVTVYEFAAPSLFRAYFGQTIYVWANVIGVILGALALGYGLGGRWADRTTTVKPLATVVGVAGGYGMLVAWLGPGVCRWLGGGEEYTQDAALPAFVAESLAASLILFAPPLVALGMATPLMVQRASASWRVGSAAGLIFAIGTVGSIAGIYLTTFAFLDWWGVRMTIRITGAVLLVVAAVLLWRGRSPRKAAATAMLAVALFPPGQGTPWDDLPPPGSRLVLAIESPYQLIRVVDRPPPVHVELETADEKDRVRDVLERLPGAARVTRDEGRGFVVQAGPRTPPDRLLDRVRTALDRIGVAAGVEPGPRPRWLAFDEGMDTYHSMQVEPGTLWTGAYYDAFARLPEWVGGGPPWRICILGNAAGTMSQLLHAHHEPRSLVLHGVEIDPEVTRASRLAMGLRDAAHPALEIFHEDGRTFLDRMPQGSYDAIVVDAYARQVSIPAALATREFFALAKSRLRDGGMLFLNLGALRPGSRLVHVLANTLAAGFGTPVARAPLHNQANVLLVAMRGGFPPPPPRDSALLIEVSFARHRSGDFVLTDDLCPVESLTARDLQLR